MKNVNEGPSDFSDDEASENEKHERRKRKKNQRRLQLNLPPITIPRGATYRRTLWCLGHVVVLSLSCCFVLRCVAMSCLVSSRVLCCYVVPCMSCGCLALPCHVLSFAISLSEF
jgi:hypothetical protein